MLLWKPGYNIESRSKVGNGETAATQVQQSVLDEGTHMRPVAQLGDHQYQSKYLSLVSVGARWEKNFYAPCVGSELHAAQPTPQILSSLPLPLALPPLDTIMRENLPGEGAISE